MDIRKFQLDFNHNILSCKVPSKIKIQMLLLNGPSFCGTDKAVLKIIIRDNKRKGYVNEYHIALVKNS